MARMGEGRVRGRGRIVQQGAGCPVPATGGGRTEGAGTRCDLPAPSVSLSAIVTRTPRRFAGPQRSNPFMKRPRASFVVIATLPFVAGCFGVVVQPVPEPVDRADKEIVGVVYDEESGGERFEFSRVDRVNWDELSVTITGAPGDDPNVVETRAFELPDLSGVLVRGLDGTKTSIIVSGLLIGAAVITAFVVTGKTEDGTDLGPDVEPIS